MLSIVAKRLLHSLGLSISALLGTICVLTLAICIPIFAYAVSGELLRNQLSEQASRSGHPLFSIRMYYLYNSKAPLDMEKVEQLSEYLPALTGDLVGIRPSQIVIQANAAPVDLTPVPNPDLPEWSQANELKQNLQFTTLEGLIEHADMLEGNWPEFGGRWSNSGCCVQRLSG